MSLDSSQRLKVPAYQAARNDFFAYQLHNFSIPHPGPHAPKNLSVANAAAGRPLEPRKTAAAVPVWPASPVKRADDSDDDINDREVASVASVPQSPRPQQQQQRRPASAVNPVIARMATRYVGSRPQLQTMQSQARLLAGLSAPTSRAASALSSPRSGVPPPPRYSSQQLTASLNALAASRATPASQLQQHNLSNSQRLDSAASSRPSTRPTSARPESSAALFTEDTEDGGDAYFDDDLVYSHANFAEHPSLVSHAQQPAQTKKSRPSSALAVSFAASPEQARAQSSMSTVHPHTSSSANKSSKQRPASAMLSPTSALTAQNTRMNSTNPLDMSLQVSRAPLNASIQSSSRSNSARKSATASSFNQHISAPATTAPAPVHHTATNNSSIRASSSPSEQSPQWPATSEVDETQISALKSAIVEFRSQTDALAVSRSLPPLALTTCNQTDFNLRKYGHIASDSAFSWQSTAVLQDELLSYLTRALVVAAAAPSTGNRPVPNNSDAASDAIEVLLQGKLTVEDIATLTKSVIDRIQALHSRARLESEQAATATAESRRAASTLAKVSEERELLTQTLTEANQEVSKLRNRLATIKRAKDSESSPTPAPVVSASTVCNACSTRDHALGRMGSEVAAMRSALERAHAEADAWRQEADAQRDAAQAAHSQLSMQLASTAAIAGAPGLSSNVSTVQLIPRSESVAEISIDTAAASESNPATARPTTPATRQSSSSPATSPSASALQQLQNELHSVRAQLHEMRSISHLNSSASAVTEATAVADQWRKRYETAQKALEETNAAADKARAAAESQRNAMIAERQRVCGQLEQQLIQAEKTIKARDQDVHSLVTAKEVLEQELSALQSKIATAERNERQVRARLSESSAAQAQLALSEARFAESEARLTELDARCNRAVSDAQRAHEQHDEQQRRHAAQLREMELRGAEAAQEAIFYRDEANIAQRRCNELETEMRDLRVQIQTRPMSAIGSPNNASALTEKLKKAEKECAQNAELASRWEDRAARAQSTAERLNTECAAHLTRVRELETQLASLQARTPQRHETTDTVDRNEVKKAAAEVEAQRKLLAMEKELFERQRAELQTEKEMLRSVTSVMNNRLMAQLSTMEDSNAPAVTNAPIQPQSSTPAQSNKKKDMTLQQRIDAMKAQCLDLEQKISTT